MEPRIQVFPKNTEVKNNHLIIGGVDVAGLCAKYGTPLYIFDELTIRQNCRDFKREFSRRYADSSVSYASKAFLHPALLKILAEEGMSLDVVSGGELSIANNAGFPMDMVYLHGNNKSAEELRLALRLHVGRIVVDSFDEIKLLSKLADESGHIPDILLRITPGVDAHTHQHITTGKLDSKFGFPLFQAAEAVGLAMAQASLNLVGFHFHIGSQIFETQPFLDAIDLVLDFAAQVQERYGFDIEELDIGGGYGVQYEVDKPAPPISAYAEAIGAKVVSKCRSLKLTPPSLNIEPGRAIIAQAGVALYTVGVIKDIPGIRLYASVDGGMGDNIRPALYEAKYEAVVANNVQSDEKEKVTIAGKFCESGDILIRDIELPSLRTGDILAVPCCGAYCLPMSSNYNGYHRPAVVMLKNGEDRLIRRRETVEDLSRLDSV
ncbi:diaminopimelate decarboxylase [Dehalococcoides mccartyi]|uniref:diaminopimelate decarboxylase n=1 Tax=Dehalococcoides mccartyi TaxID=61435 RepID=UPI0002B767A0|nr:diaminopimelate decarboxylase [Dehalococcoides mccartyi]AGG07603.1 diaminopimelate decarboxylase [Dehalococcoides mccartyi BTF08]KSV16805.1 diaminopimelate decarboxylase [Dehalococcoides mccartyi]